MQQVLAGMNELNGRLQKAEAEQLWLRDKLKRYSRNSYDRKLE